MRGGRAAGYIFLAALAALAAPVSAGTVDEPGIRHPAGARLIREIRLEGALLERAKQSSPGLSGIEQVVIRRYCPAGERGRGRRSQPRILEHFEKEMERLRWEELLSQDSAPGRGAAYASPDGRWLFGIAADGRGVATSLIRGEVSLEQIPYLERVVAQALAPAVPAFSPEDRKIAARAQELMKGGRPEEAERILREALADRPGAVLLRRQLASVLAARGRSNDSIEELRRAVALDPMGYGHRLEYARALYETGKDLQGALHEFTRAAALAPGQGTPLYFIGRIHEDLGRYEESLAAYRQAGELAPHWLSIPLRMAGIYEEKLKDPARAEAAYLRALQVDPRCAAAREGLERVRRAKSGRR